MARDRITFGHGLDVTKVTDDRVKVDVDESELTTGGDLEGPLNDVSVKEEHAGSTHASIIAGALTVEDLAAHAATSEDVHGIIAAADLETQAGAASKVADHEVAADPHAGYQRESEKGSAGGYATLDGTGKVPVAQLPASTTNDVWPVASQAAMLALPAAQGDIAIRSDVGKTFALSTNSPSTLADWLELPPGSGVTSVNGRTGVVTGVQDTSQKGSADGYAGLDASGQIIEAQVPSSIARDTELADAISLHTASVPHAHADLAAHDVLGLATQAELDAHAASGHTHPNLAAHDSLGLATDAELLAHGVAADPHAGYQKESEKGQPSGFASLDVSGRVPDVQIPDAISRDAEVASSIAAHAALTTHIDITEALPERYVSTSGSDSDDGRFDRPFQTIAVAVAALPTTATGKAGLVKLRPGQHVQTVDLVGLNGLAIEGLGGRVVGVSTHGAVIIAGANNVKLLSFLDSGVAMQGGPILRNLQLDGGGFTGVTGLHVRGYNRADLQDCSVRRCANGIYLDSNGLDSAWHDFYSLHMRENTIGINAYRSVGLRVFGGDFIASGSQISIKLGDTAAARLTQNVSLFGPKFDGGVGIDSQCAAEVSVLGSVFESCVQAFNIARVVAQANSGRRHHIISDTFSGSGTDRGIYLGAGVDQIEIVLPGWVGLSTANRIVNDSGVEPTVIGQALGVFSPYGVAGVYKSGVGRTNGSDADFPVAPRDGTIEVVRNSTDGKVYIAARANGAWGSTEVSA